MVPIEEEEQAGQEEQQDDADDNADCDVAGLWGVAYVSLCVVFIVGSWTGNGTILWPYDLLLAFATVIIRLRDTNKDPTTSGIAIVLGNHENPAPPGQWGDSLTVGDVRARIIPLLRGLDTKLSETAAADLLHKYFEIKRIQKAEAHCPKLTRCRGVQKTSREMGGNSRRARGGRVRRYRPCFT